MAKTRRSFTPEYRVEAAHRVIDTGRAIAEVAREVSVGEQLLGRWVREERTPMEAASGVVAPPAEIPLTESERVELSRLRKKSKDKEVDISSLTVPAAASDAVRAAARGLVVHCNHSTKSRTSAEVGPSHVSPRLESQRHQRNNPNA